MTTKQPNIEPFPWNFWKAPRPKRDLPSRYYQYEFKNGEVKQAGDRMWEKMIADARLVRKGAIADPWARVMDEYKKFTWQSKLRLMFPGLGVALLAFASYSAYDWFSQRESLHEFPAKAI